MKILVIGLGSMGKRRIRLINGRCEDHALIGVDSREDRREEAKTFGVVPYDSLDEAFAEEPDLECAFICTSPVSHAALIGACLEHGLHVFTEINLVDDLYEQNMRLAQEKGKVLFLSSTFLYRKEIQHIQRRVREFAGKLNYIYHVGQYLPDWHPWESYSEYFIGAKRTNGCREIMAIEMPWIVNAFGDIESVSSLHEKNSTLKIDYDDSYLITVRHRDGTKGIFAVDLTTPKAVRNLEIYGEKFYLSWNGKPDGLEECLGAGTELCQVSLYEKAVHMDGYQATIIEDAYAGEIDEFFQVIRGLKKPAHSFEKDLEILRWIDRIEE